MKNVHQEDDLTKHPKEYQKDLNPNAMAGQNLAPQAAQAEKSARTAYDLKPAHNKLNHLLDDDLKQIPVLEEGIRLKQGATYFDLKHPERGEITATGEMSAGPDNWYVPKSEVHYNLWNLLIGTYGTFSSELTRLSGSALREIKNKMQSRERGRKNEK